MPPLLRVVLRVLGWFLACDVAGVLLTLLCDVTGSVHRTWETSAALGYVIWAVVGVFCGALIYFGNDELESEEGRMLGVTTVAATAAVAIALGVASAFVWSSSEGVEPVAPDHLGITLTYLVTVVLTVGVARFVLLRESPTAPESLARLPVVPADSPTVRAAAAQAPEGDGVGDGDNDGEKPFRPSGFWGTAGWALGLPLLLFFDVSFFLLGPFDAFDRWTDVLLPTSLVAGLGWGLMASRWPEPRHWLLVLHAPLLLGTLFYFFGLLPAAVLASLGAPEWLSNAVPFVGFTLGFSLGCVALGGAASDAFARMARRSE